MKDADEAGDYYAICNKTNFNGYYVEQFTFPKEHADQGVSASWYFLNVVNGHACLHMVLPVKLCDHATNNFNAEKG